MNVKRVRYIEYETIGSNIDNLSREIQWRCFQGPTFKVAKLDVPGNKQFVNRTCMESIM